MSLINRLTLHHGLAGFGIGLFLAVQTLFLQEKGFDLWQIGLLFGTFGATTAVLELPLGAMADIHGRVRVYGVSRLLVLAGVLLAALMDSFWGAMAAIALLGIGRALDSGSIEAWQVDRLNASNQGDRIPSAIARFHVATALAIACGALLGGYLPDWLEPVRADKMRPTEWNLWAQAAVTGVHLLLLRWLFHEGDPKQPQAGDGGIRSQLRIAVTFGFGNPRLKSVFATAVIIGLVLFSLEAYWQPRVTQIAPGVDYAVFGWLAAGYFLAAALGPMVIGVLNRRFPITPDRLILGIVLMLGPLMAILALQEHLAGYAPAYLMFMLVLSMINAPFEMLMAEEVPSEVRSTLFSVLSLSLQLGGVVMAYGLSYAVQWIGIDGLWLGLAGLLALRGLTGCVGRRLPRVEARAEAS
ncbi:MFS transporter [Saccharospirillum salsuginis]|uniref:MFS transporter n=1 Tax=Saccharospirillum salsuginis TaxID=418750 RepID=A0A918NDL0_9GAMM|nr:MFS transporter [Saccharospirillum salsuginis]GGX59460.1 MFS transporter [Saccharospirillum salsuginis]